MCWGYNVSGELGAQSANSVELLPGAVVDERPALGPCP